MTVDDRAVPTPLEPGEQVMMRHGNAVWTVKGYRSNGDLDIVNEKGTTPSSRQRRIQRHRIVSGLVRTDGRPIAAKPKP